MSADTDRVLAAIEAMRARANAFDLADGTRAGDPYWYAQQAADVDVPALADVAEAAARLLEAMAVADNAIGGIFAVAAIHGFPYKGPSYGDERHALAAALARLAEEVAG